VANRLGKHYSIPVEVVTDRPAARVRRVLGEDVSCIEEDRASFQSLPERTRVGDIVIGGMPPTRAGLDRRASQLARALPGRTLMMVAGR
jgi:hypothetical protein